MIVVRKYIIWLLILLLLTGCDLLGGDGVENGRADANAESEAETAETEEEFKCEADPPAEGKGNVCGEIRWNGKGEANLDVKICQDFSSFTGCIGEEIEIKTDADGKYLFENVPPGLYSISIRVGDENWLYVSSGILSSAEFEVEAGETFIVGRQNIFKLDLELAEPEILLDGVTLEWSYQAENLDYYKLSLYPDQGDAILIDKRVEADENGTGAFTQKLLPVSCGYRWQVEAYNSDRVKIAESLEQGTFVVDSLDGSCQLTIQEPADGAEIRGDDIVLDWDESPVATSYKILMWNDDDPNRANVLDFVTVNESSYRFDQTLEPARYVWSVTAYDENGDKIGGTEIYDFTVRP